jgi:hypothetical protein
MTNVNLFASIIPCNSAGGYVIGTSISSYEDFSGATMIDTNLKSIGQWLLHSEGWTYTENWWSDQGIFYGKTYYYKDDIVRLQFNSNGVLYCICLSNGYQGKAFDKIGVNCNESEVKKMFDIEYNSGDEMYYPINESEIVGISFFVSQMSIEECIDDGKILMICIHNWDLANQVENREVGWALPTNSD